MQQIHQPYINILFTCCIFMQQNMMKVQLQNQSQWKTLLVTALEICHVVRRKSSQSLQLQLKKCPLN